MPPAERDRLDMWEGCSWDPPRAELLRRKATSVFSPAESTSVASCGNTPCTRRRRNNLSPALLLLAEAPEIKGRRPRPEAGAPLPQLWYLAAVATGS